MSQDRKPGPVEASWDGWKPDDECGDGDISTGPDDDLLPACRLHDFEYKSHDTGEERNSRLRVDRRFLRRGLLIARNQPTLWRKAKVATKTIVYYGIIRAVGWWPWRRGTTIAGKLYKDGGVR